MPTVELSQKYTIDIPRALCESMHITPGQRLDIVQYGDRLELVPIRPFAEMRGFLKGVDSCVVREDDRV